MIEGQSLPEFMENLSQDFGQISVEKFGETSYKMPGESLGNISMQSHK